jgi:hypothetical protein
MMERTPEYSRSRRVLRAYQEDISSRFREALPDTVEIKGSNLAPAGVSSPDCAPGYCWQASDFLNNQLPAKLHGVSVTVNGKSAYVYYISPTQVNILTPPETTQGAVMVQLTNNSASSRPFTCRSSRSLRHFSCSTADPTSPRRTWAERCWDLRVSTPA